MALLFFIMFVCFLSICEIETNVDLLSMARLFDLYDLNDMTRVGI